jgi:hypothetical protein
MLPPCMQIEIEGNDKTIDKLVRQCKRLQKQREEDKQHMTSQLNDIREMRDDLKTLKRMLRREIIEHEATIAKSRKLVAE